MGSVCGGRVPAANRCAVDAGGTDCVSCAASVPAVPACPQVYNAARFGVALLPDFPTIKRLNDTLTALPAFKAAAPEAQPDAA